MTAAPLRLAIYMADFSGGGVERITLMLLEAFAARGVDVTLVVHNASGPLRSLLPASVRLVSLGVGRSLSALPRLAGFLRREQPDALLSSLGHNNIVAIWARALARASSHCTTRLVVCQHNALSTEAGAIGTWQHRLLPRLYALFGRQADAIVGVSHGVSRDLAETTGLPADRIVTIHNPVLDRRFEAALGGVAPHPWLRDRSLRVIVGIGRLVPQKDFATLLAAFARLDRADTRLLILGEGPERARLERIAAQLGRPVDVALPGFVIEPLPWLRDAAVVVMSSAYEGFGNVLVEALGAGTPVVSTRCPYGPDEILEDGRYGELVPVGDPEALAAAIGRQLDDPRPSPALRRARADDFRADVVAGRYLALLRAEPAAPALSAGGDARLARGICIYLPELRIGGAELTLLQLAGCFAARGVAVTLVLHALPVEAIALPAGVAVRTLELRRSLAAVRPLARLLRQSGPGVLLSAFPHSNLVAVAARALAGIDCAVVISEHAPLRIHADRMGGWRYGLLPPLIRWAYPRADAVVAVSEGVRVDLAGIVPKVAARVVHNPVLAVDWASRAAEPVEHPWLGDASLAVVLSVSRLAAEKDLPMLLTAFARAAGERPGARLVIAGDGPERAALQAAVQSMGLVSRVQLVGFVANPLAWMRRARVLVLASRYEGFGNVLVEALAAGTRVVSTDCPVGPREVLEDGRWGRLVPVGDAPALAAAVGEALDAPPDPAARAAASASMQARFGCERACEAYFDLVRSI